MSENFCKPFDYLDAPQSAGLLDLIGRTESHRPTTEAVCMVFPNGAVRWMFDATPDKVRAEMNAWLDGLPVGVRAEYAAAGACGGCVTVRMLQREALELQEYARDYSDCDVCHGDCAAANPPVANCPSNGGQS